MSLVDTILRIIRGERNHDLQRQQVRSDATLDDARRVLKDSENERLREEARLRALDARIGLPLRRRE